MRVSVVLGLGLVGLALCHAAIGALITRGGQHWMIAGFDPAQLADPAAAGRRMGRLAFRAAGLEIAGAAAVFARPDWAWVLAPTAAIAAVVVVLAGARRAARASRSR